MKFDISDEQAAFQAAVADYLADHCTNAERLASFEDDGVRRTLWSGLCGLGLPAIAVPEAQGGLGLDWLDVALVAEVLGRFACPSPFIEHSLATLAIATAGDEAQRRRWLPGLATGEITATLALAEPGAKWLPEDWALPGGPDLTGQKIAVPNLDLAQLIVVGTRGGGLAVAERGARGLQETPEPALDPTRPISTLCLEATPAEPLPGATAAIAARLRDAALILLAADAFGGAERCLEASCDYLKDREQFGVPIASFQAVKHQLANLAVLVAPARGLWWYAAHVFDRDPAAAPLAAAMAKAHLSEVYTQVTRAMIELHGGIGYTWDFGAHVWLRRAVYDRFVSGEPKLHYQRIAAMSGWHGRDG